MWLLGVLGFLLCVHRQRAFSQCFNYILGLVSTKHYHMRSLPVEKEEADVVPEHCRIKNTRRVFPRLQTMLWNVLCPVERVHPSHHLPGLFYSSVGSFIFLFFLFRYLITKTFKHIYFTNWLWRKLNSLWCGRWNWSRLRNFWRCRRKNHLRILRSSSHFDDNWRLGRWLQLFWGHIYQTNFLKRALVGRCLRRGLLKCSKNRRLLQFVVNTY